MRAGTPSLHDVSRGAAALTAMPGMISLVLTTCTMCSPGSKGDRMRRMPFGARDDDCCCDSICRGEHQLANPLNGGAKGDAKEWVQPRKDRFYR